MAESIVESYAEAVLNVARTERTRVLHVDDDPTFLSIAKQCLEMQGEIDVDTASSVYEASEKLKKKDYDAIVCDYQMPGKDGLEFLKDLRANGNSTPFIIFTGKGREEIAVKALNLGASGYFNKHGEPETVYGELAHGIRAAVEQKKATEALSAERDKLETVTRNIGAGLAIISKDYHTLWANDVLKRIFGDVEGKICYSTYNQRNDICPECGVHEIFETGKSKVVHEQVGKGVDGKTVWSEIAATPVKDTDGNVTAVLELVVPITHRKRAEEELRDSEEKYRSLVELAPDGIVAVNAEGIITSANRSFLTLVGYNSEEIVGKPFTELKTSRVEDIPKFQSMFKSLMKGEPSSPVEFLYVRRDGTSRWAEVHPSLLTKDGNPVGAQVIMRDVTERKNTEKLIQEDQQKFEQLFMSNPEAAVYVDPDERVLNVNPRFTELFGYSFDEVNGKLLDDLLVPNDRKKEAIMLAQKGREGYVYYETVRKNKKGSLIPLIMSSAPIKLQDQHLGDVVLYRDITERKRVEEALRESEETLRSIVENSSDQIFMLDRNYRFLSINKTAANLFRSSPQEMLGMSISEIFPEAIAAQFLKNIKNVFDTGKSMFIDEKMVVKGRELYNSTSLDPVRDDRGRVIAVTGIVRDITERKKVEEEKSRLLHDLQGRAKELSCLYAISRLFEKSDILLDDALQGTADLLPPAMQYPDITCARVLVENREFSTRNFKETRWKLQADIEVLGKKAGFVEVCYLEERPTLAEGPFLKEERPLIDAIAERLGKITERKRAEKMLQESEERFRAIFEGANDGILVADVKTKRFFFANPRICEITGYSLEELLKLGVGDIIPKKDLPYVIDSFEKQRQGKVALSKDVPVLRKDEKVVYCDVNSRPLKIGSQEYLVGIFRDVTESKKAEEKLEESEEKYKTTFESSMEALMLLGEASFIDCNNATLLLFGCKSVEEFTKYHPADLSPPTQPDGAPSMEAAMSHINKALKTGSDSFFWIHKRVNGATFPADVLLTRMPLKGRSVLQATVRDITKQKEAEEKSREDSDRIEMMNEKLRVVGGLSRHDVNNKLSAVTGYAYLLKKKHADQADIVEGLGMMEQAVKEVGKIFDFAKIYEKLGVEELTYVDVEKTLDEAVALFSGLTIKVVNGCHGLTVLADSFLRQLFYNFIDNTRKYGGKATAVKVYYEKAESGELRLVYEDDGVGISAENKLKLFTKGFSTGGSTGFGLFLIRKMMDVYGWQIQETGEPGKGAKFVIAIPKANLNREGNFQLS